MLQSDVRRGGAKYDMITISDGAFASGAAKLLRERLLPFFSLFNGFGRGKCSRQRVNGFSEEANSLLRAGMLSSAILLLFGAIPSTAFYLL